MGYHFHFSSFWLKKHSKLILNSGLKSRFLFCLIFQFYLMYRLICQKPAHFVSAKMALVSTFFQMFIVLEMYKFGCLLKGPTLIGMGRPVLLTICCRIFAECFFLFFFANIFQKTQKYISTFSALSTPFLKISAFLIKKT